VLSERELPGCRGGEACRFRCNLLEVSFFDANKTLLMEPEACQCRADRVDLIEVGAIALGGAA
jgi:hypothetical protein